jgi:hypothetical protein
MAAVESRVDLTLARLVETTAADVHRLEVVHREASARHDAAFTAEEHAFDKWDRRPRSWRLRVKYEQACAETNAAERAFNLAAYELRRARRRLEDLTAPWERERRVAQATRNQELRQQAQTGGLLT